MTAPQLEEAVVPGYYLVCYNWKDNTNKLRPAVVPGYYLVCYNFIASMFMNEVL